MFGFIHEPSKCFRTQSKEEKRETVALAQTVFFFSEIRIVLWNDSWYAGRQIEVWNSIEPKLKTECKTIRDETRSDIFECKTRLKKSKKQIHFWKFDRNYFVVWQQKVSIEKLHYVLLKTQLIWQNEWGF